MDKPKKFIHWKDSTRAGGDVVFGRFVLPVVVLIWGVFALWTGSAVYGMVWDMAFDGKGAGVVLFSVVTGVIFVPVVITGLIRGVCVGWNMIKEANDRSLR